MLPQMPLLRMSIGLGMLSSLAMGANYAPAYKDGFSRCPNITRGTEIHHRWALPVTDHPFLVSLNEQTASFVGYDFRLEGSITDYEALAVQFARDGRQDLITSVRDLGPDNPNGHLVFKSTNYRRSDPNPNWLLIAQSHELKGPFSIIIFHKVPNHLYGFDDMSQFLAELAEGNTIAFGAPSTPVNSYIYERLEEDFRKNGRSYLPFIRNEVEYRARALALFKRNYDSSIIRIFRPSDKEDLLYGSFEFLDLKTRDFGAIRFKDLNMPAGFYAFRFMPIFYQKRNSRWDDPPPPLETFLTKVMGRQE